MTAPRSRGLTDQPGQHARPLPARLVTWFALDGAAGKATAAIICTAGPAAAAGFAAQEAGHTQPGAIAFATAALAASLWWAAVLHEAGRR